MPNTFYKMFFTKTCSLKLGYILMNPVSLLFIFLVLYLFNWQKPVLQWCHPLGGSDIILDGTHISEYQQHIWWILRCFGVFGLSHCKTFPYFWIKLKICNITFKLSCWLSLAITDLSSLFQSYFLASLTWESPQLFIKVLSQKTHKHIQF